MNPADNPLMSTPVYRPLYRPTDLTFLNDEGEHILVAGEAHD